VFILEPIDFRRLRSPVNRRHTARSRDGDHDRPGDVGIVFRGHHLERVALCGGELRPGKSNNQRDSLHSQFAFTLLEGSGLFVAGMVTDFLAPSSVGLALGADSVAPPLLRQAERAKCSHGSYLSFPCIW
jgi:hypothetical protein